MAADACAQGSRFGIGGYIRLPNSPPAWFSESYTLDDLACLNLPLAENAQRDIGCYELLAQIALVLLLAASVPGGRARICVRSLCDNSSAEAAINKLMTTSSPMCFFAQQLALVAFSATITLDCQHISGFRAASAFPLPSFGRNLGPSKFSLRTHNCFGCPLDMCLAGSVAALPQRVGNTSVAGGSSGVASFCGHGRS